MIKLLFTIKKNTAAVWANANTILENGEMGLETDTRQFKIGDAVTPWNDLTYGAITGPQGIQGAIGAKGDTGAQGVQGNAGPNQVATSTASNITGLLKGDGSHVAASSLAESDLSDAISKKHANTNDPSSGEKSALAGTTGTPGSGNKFVTDSDTRNTNARTPTTHSHAPGDVTGTAVITSDSRLSDARPASDVSAWAKAGTKPTYNSSDVGALSSSGTAADVNVSGANIASALSGKLSTSGVAADVNASGTNIASALSGKVTTNGAITGATKTKVTYDAKGLVTSGADATTSDINDSTDKRYCTDAQKTVIGNTSGTNSGNETASTIKTALGITTLSGSNTGDQAIPAGASSVTAETSFGNSSNAGSAATYSKGDHTHGTPTNPVSLATPTIVLGSAAAAGSAATLIRSDSTIAAFDTTAPAAVTPDAAATAGSIAFAARRDHQHGVATYSSAPAKDTPGALGAAGTSGAAPSRGDHTHQCPGGLITNTGQVSVGPSSSSEVTICTFDIPANFLTAGSQFLFRFRGTLQSQATSGIMTLRMYVGATAGQTVVYATQTSAVAASPVQFEGIATVRTIGSGGTYISTGILDIINAATTRLAYGQGGASTTAVNTTATVTVKMTAQWATSSSTNVILIQNAAIEIVKM
jgi:hypothetical protein